MQDDLRLAGLRLLQEMPFSRVNGQGQVIIVTLGHTAAEVEQLARPLADAGTDFLGLVSYRAKDAAPMVAAAKQRASVPVLIKTSVNWPELLDVAADCLDAGTDGITAIDSNGPALRIDIEKGEPWLGRFAWLSGDAIRPIALRVVADICLRHHVPVVGTGGISLAEDVVEMVMAGATAVGVLSAPLQKGLAWLGKTQTRLGKWMEKRGCGGCVTAGAYQTRQLSPEGDMLLDVIECRSCGLCVTICPASPLTMYIGQ